MTGADQGKPRTAEAAVTGRQPGVPIRGFVALDEIAVELGGPPTIAAPAALAADTWDARTSLFGEVER